MFDATANITLFDVKTQNSSANTNSNRLVINSCKAIVHDKIYSELEELNFANINSNNYDYGYIEYEFGFNEKFENPYKTFYISLFAIRGNLLGYPIKINPQRPSTTPKRRLNKNYSKVNKDGNMSLGVRYFFRSLKERETLIDGDEVLIEGCIALDTRKNNYDIMCRIIKDGDEWILDEANTYRTHKKMDLYRLWH